MSKAIVVHSEFMKKLIDLISDDPDQYTPLLSTLFSKLHLSLSSIRIEKFREAEQHLEFLKVLLDFKIA